MKPRTPLVAPALMLASGAAALGCQLVWTQQAALWLGHDGAAALAVVAAFFGGLAVGAWGVAPRLERFAEPARAYAACEALIGLWGGVLALGLPLAGPELAALMGAAPQSSAWPWAVAFSGTFLLLLPATAAMGATLPIMARVTEAWRSRGAHVGGLYAANTAGALLGVLAVLAGSLPTFGLRGTALACAALNLLCAVLAWRLAGTAGPAPAPAPATAAGRHLLALLAATGLLGIGLEVLALRVLSQVTENTVYTFAALLAVYLLFTALGAALHAALAPEMPAPRHRAMLLLALALATLAGGAALWGAELQRDQLAALLDGGLAQAVFTEASLCVSALALPALLMGALFSQLMAEARLQGHSFGHALGVNTAAAAFAPMLFGLWGMPAVGAKPMLLAMAGGYALLAWPWRGLRPLPAATAVALAGIAMWAPPLVFVDVPDGGRVVSHVEGVLAAVSVVEDGTGAQTLRINNRQQEGSSVTVPADARQALLPLLLHPSPRHALFLGLGTGITAGAATMDPALQVEAVELLPEVVAASVLFSPSLAGAADRTRLHVHVADARRFVRTAMRRYDLVVADNFHPARSGSGALYTVEHFLAVRDLLDDGGLFCQWLPLHQLDLPTLRSVVRSYLAVFPQARALLATHSLGTPVIGLVSHADGRPFAARTGEGFRVPAERFGLRDPLSVLGSFVAGPAALAAFAEGAAWNTDDSPVVAWLAPAATYGPQPTPAERLQGLLAQWTVSPAEIAPEADAASLAAYLAARRRFLAAGMAVRPTADPRQMLAQVREPLLAVLRTCPDFEPAREPLLQLAEALQDRDAGAAAAIRDDVRRLGGQGGCAP